MNKPEIKQAIEEKLKRLESEQIAEASEIMKKLTAVMRDETTEEMIYFEKGKLNRTTKQPTLKDKLKAIELLCKMKGLFVTRQEIEMMNQRMSPVIIVDDIKD